MKLSRIMCEQVGFWWRLLDLEPFLFTSLVDDIFRILFVTKWERYLRVERRMNSQSCLSALDASNFSSSFTWTSIEIIIIIIIMVTQHNYGRTQV